MDADDLFEWWGYPAPLAFRDLLLQLAEIAEGGQLSVEDLFYQLTGQYLCTTEYCYPQTPPELFTVAHMGVDGVHYGYVIHAPELPATDYPIGEICPMNDEGVFLVGNSTVEAIENLASEHIGHAAPGAEEGHCLSETLLQICRAIGLKPDRSKPRRRYDPDGNGRPVIPEKPAGWIHQTSADGIGVLAPRDTFRPGPYVRLDYQTPAIRFQELADAALSDGFPATALLLLRNGFWYNWTDEWVAERFSSRMEGVYTALGRPSLAEGAARRMQRIRDIGSRRKPTRLYSSIRRRSMECKRVCWPERGRAELVPFEPKAPGSGEVLIETEVTLISPGTERAFFLGLPNAEGRYPSYPGYCNVGRVAAVGDGVERVQVGDRVASGLGHSSHGVTRAERCWKVPEGLEPTAAVYHSLGAIALQGVRKARVELGETVLVIGLGLIGNLALQLARQEGALPAIGLDPDAGRRELATTCGADACFDPGDADTDAALAELTEGRGPAVVIEATGSAEVVNDALTRAATHGRVVLLASTRGVTETNFYRDVHKKGLILLGAHANIHPPHDSSPGFWTLDDDTRLVLRLLAASRLRVDRLTTEIAPCAEAPRLYEQLASWRKDALGMILDWRS